MSKLTAGRIGQCKLDLRRLQAREPISPESSELIDAVCEALQTAIELEEKLVTA